jgi:hypothetical protein
MIKWKREIKKSGKEEWNRRSNNKKVKQPRYTPWRRLGGEEL